MKNLKIHSILLLTMSILLLTVGIRGTVAYLVDVTGSVENKFIPTEVTCEVVEDGWVEKSKSKEMVQIKNTGDIDAYIRVAVIANWCNSEGQIVASYDPDLKLGQKWEEDDGFYYYTEKVISNGLTGNLLSEAITPSGTLPTNADHVEVSIICQAIQADGLDVTSYSEAWDKVTN